MERVRGEDRSEELQQVKREREELKQILSNRQEENGLLLKEKEREIQSYQYGRSILEIKINDLENSVDTLKSQKKALEDKLSNITSNNEINSLKLISKVAVDAHEEEEEPKVEVPKETDYLEHILEDKTRQLETVYKLYQNVQDQLYQTKNQQEVVFVEEAKAKSELAEIVQNIKQELHENEIVLEEKDKEISLLKSELKDKENLVE